MKKKEQVAYFEQQWKEMKGYFSAFILEGKQDDLHSFRVQIKRLRSLFIMFESADKHDKNELQQYFKPVRNIFKHAGEIRNAHVNLLLGQKYKIKNDQFEIGQRLIIENGVAKFKLKGKKYLDKIDRSYKAIEAHLAHLRNKDIKKFYNRQLQEIADGLADNKFDDDLHANRRKIKILVYNHKLIDSKLESELQFNNDYMDELQGNIGDWHDNVLAIALFTSEQLNDLPVAERIKKKNYKLQNTIRALSGDFMKRAASGNSKEEPQPAETEAT